MAGESEYAARDLLLRLEEKGLIELPPRLRSKNNGKQNAFLQAPLSFSKIPLEGPLGRYGEPFLRLVTPHGKLSLGLSRPSLSLSGATETGGGAC